MQQPRHIISSLAGSTRALLLLSALGLIFSASPALLAQPGRPSQQERPDLYACLPDSLCWYLVTPYDTVKPEWIAHSYIFTMAGDSTCQTTYELGDWRHNGALVRLTHYKEGRTVNANAALLSYNSGTDVFTCHTGDTLSFVRALMWRNPMTSWRDTNAYFAPDSLDYSVELVRNDDSVRLVLLDSIGILANPTPGRPRVHGTHPLLVHLKYRVPSSLDGVPAFMRIRVYHRGAGKYWFTRQDDMQIHITFMLQDPFWTPFINFFTPAMPRVRVEGSSDQPDAADGEDVIASAPRPREIEVSLAESGEGDESSVGVYDMSGDGSVYPLPAGHRGARVVVTHRVASAGVYVVAVIRGGRITAVRKVAVVN